MWPNHRLHSFDAQTYLFRKSIILGQLRRTRIWRRRKRIGLGWTWNSKGTKVRKTYEDSHSYMNDIHFIPEKLPVESAESSPELCVVLDCWWQITSPIEGNTKWMEGEGWIGWDDDDEGVKGAKAGWAHGDERVLGCCSGCCRDVGKLWRPWINQ